MSKTPLMVDLSKKRGSTCTVGGRTFNIHYPNASRADANGTPKGWSWHWSACDQLQLFDDYQFCISENATHDQAIVFKMLAWNEKGQHTWQRNSNLIGGSFACSAGSALTKPSPLMLDAGALLTAEGCAWKQIDPRGKFETDRKVYNRALDTMSSTGQVMKVDTLMDHRSYAMLDGYYPDRVDIDGSMFTEFKKRVLNYYDALKKGKAKFVLLDLLKN